MGTGMRSSTGDGWNTSGAPLAGVNGNGRSGGGKNGEGLATFLGWFSIGLGVAQLAAPRRMALLVGASGDAKSQTTMRAIGVREIAAGVGLLTQRRSEWAWGRVAGDVMDLTLLGRTMASPSADTTRAASAAAAVAGIGALDVICAQRLGNGSGRSAESGVHVHKAITVNRPAEEVYDFWRNFENLPRFMQHLESVQVLDGEGRRSHWKAKAPAKTTVEWDAEMIDDRPNELIAWRSAENADVPNAGTVRFVRAAGGRGTEVHVDLHYDPPAGKLGALVAKLFGEEPNQQVAGDLRRFKQVLETGEVVYSDATLKPGMHPAHPPKERQLPREDFEQRLVVERSADAVRASSNRDRTSSTPTGADRPAERPVIRI